MRTHAPRCRKPAVGTHKTDLRLRHRAKMTDKAARRGKWHAELTGSFGATARIEAQSSKRNRRTGEPHQHRAEIARRLNQKDNDA